MQTSSSDSKHAGFIIRPQTWIFEICTGSHVLNTAWKVSKYGVFSGPYFPHSDWIRRDTDYSPYSIRMRENTDQKKLCSWTFSPSERFRSFEKSSSLFYMIYFFAKNYCEVLLGNLWLTSFKNSCERMQLLVKMQAAGLMQLYKM